MHVIIVEDEHPAADYLEQLLIQQKILSIQKITLIDSVESAVTYLSLHTPDLIFLDIHLADGISWEIFEKVSVNAPIIFTTAYDSYTLEAFKHFAIDYLIKPFDSDTLNRSLIKFNSIQQRIIIDQAFTLSKWVQHTDNFQEHFLVKFGQEMRAIPASDIAYFYASGKHLFIYTFTRESYLYESTIRDIIHYLNPRTFFKINRNYVLNIH